MHVKLRCHFAPRATLGTVVQGEGGTKLYQTSVLQKRSGASGGHGNLAAFSGLSSLGCRRSASVLFFKTCTNLPGFLGREERLFALVFGFVLFFFF